MHGNVSFTPLFVILCYAPFRGPCKKTKQNELRGAALHKPQQAQGNVRDLQPAGSPPDPVRAFRPKMRDPGTALSCFDLVLPLRLPSRGLKV